MTDCFYFIIHTLGDIKMSKLKGLFLKVSDIAGSVSAMVAFGVAALMIIATLLSMVAVSSF